MKKSAAFTLIELLVVIVIIAILAGIALPVFSKVLEKGRVTQDCSNLRQLGIGTVAYLNDNNDTLFNLNTQVSSNNYMAPGLLEVNYVPNPKAFQSPFDKRGTAIPNPVSYGVNAYLLGPASAKPAWDSNWTRLAAASQLVLYCPVYTNNDPKDPSNVKWSGTDIVAWYYAPGVTNCASILTGTHQNYKWIDVLYADMHVASVKYTDFQVTSDKSASGGVDGLNQWQPLGHGN